MEDLLSQYSFCGMKIPSQFCKYSEKARDRVKVVANKH